jgi:hypothetical protein
MKMPKVNTKYGAPMGRPSYGVNPVGKVRLFQVDISSGGYDNGGAYWGLGKPLYCAMDEGDNYIQYVRADSRFHACVELGLEPQELYNPPVEQFLHWVAVTEQKFYPVKQELLKLVQAAKDLGFDKYLKKVKE